MTQHPLHWFRHSSSYINSHRGKTFVIMLSGEAISDPNFDALVQDIALLHSLNIRLVIVHGARPQIDSALVHANIKGQFHRHVRITSMAMLPLVLGTIGSTRLSLESQFYKSPTINTHNKITTISGNFISAKPLGIHDGIDYEFTGEVRRVDTNAIKSNLDCQHIVIISSLGFSSTGEVFNLEALDVATHTATALQADKLILFGDSDGMISDGTLLREITAKQATKYLQKHHHPPQLINAVNACTQGVGRVHLLSYKKDGAILEELFTTDGAGTMISQNPYDVIRPASSFDILGISELTAPLEQAGILISRSRQQIEAQIECYYVIERDGKIIGCASLHELDEHASEIASVVISGEYRRGSRGVDLLRFIEKIAKAQGKSRLFALTTRTAHWFIEQGFVPASPSDLPASRLAQYHNGRNSKVLIKAL